MLRSLLSRQELVDAQGRAATDLRVSLTDRCSLRCTYCMPADGLAWIPSRDLLTGAEIVRLVGLAVTRLGVARIRFTGGEPLLRPDLVEIVSACARLRSASGEPVELSMTTNGLRLDRVAAALAEAGLNRVNVSLDSLDPRRYRALTRRGRVEDVLRGLAAASAAGLRPVKVNTVAMRGVNEADVVPLLDFCLRNGYRLRFIEHMPLGPEHSWGPASMIPSAEILDRLSEHFELRRLPGRTSAPATEWHVAASACHPDGTVGVISSVTAPFCATCDRTRLTADGHLRTCLFSDEETDLRTALRRGAGDDALAELWRRAHVDKPAGHRIGRSDFVQPVRSMSAIGG